MYKNSNIDNYRRYFDIAKIGQFWERSEAQQTIYCLQPLTDILSRREGRKGLGGGGGSKIGKFIKQKKPKINYVG